MADPGREERAPRSQPLPAEPGAAKASKRPRRSAKGKPKQPKIDHTYNWKERSIDAIGLLLLIASYPVIYWERLGVEGFLLFFGGLGLLWTARQMHEGRIRSAERKDGDAT